MEKENKITELKEVTEELIGWENNKIFKTFNDLTTRPGPMIREYCNGGKQKYLSPVVYFFAVTTVEIYIVSASGINDLMLKSTVESLRKDLSGTEELKMNVDQITGQFNDFMTFLLSETGQKLVFLPVILLLTWLLYKRYNPSFKANSWFALYTLGHVTLLNLPLLLCIYFTGDLVLYSLIALTVSVIYVAWASMKFYGLSVGRAIFLRILMIVVWMVAAQILGITLILINL